MKFLSSFFLLLAFAVSSTTAQNLSSTHDLMTEIILSSSESLEYIESISNNEYSSVKLLDAILLATLAEKNCVVVKVIAKRTMDNNSTEYYKIIKQADICVEISDDLQLELINRMPDDLREQMLDNQ